MKWAASSEFVSSSIPSWQILTAHGRTFRGARDLAFCLKVLLDSLLVWASSGVSGETARMRRLAWTFAARIGDKYQIHLTRPKLFFLSQTILQPLHAKWPEVLEQRQREAKYLRNDGEFRWHNFHYFVTIGHVTRIVLYLFFANESLLL